MKRHLFKLVVLLLLGAIVNVAVAWGFAVRPNPVSQPSQKPRRDISRYEWISPNRFQTKIWERTGEMRVTQSRGIISITSLVRLPQPRPRRLNDSKFRDLIPCWSAFGTPEVLAQSDGEFFVEQAAGWPLLCLRLDRRSFFGEGVASPYSETSGSLELPLFRPPWRNTVPYHPIWPGFPINTAFYAVLLWMLWLSPFVVRRVIRRQRGLCLKCGYDLRGAEHEVCPECGVGV